MLRADVIIGGWHIDNSDNNTLNIKLTCQKKPASFLKMSSKEKRQHQSFQQMPQKLHIYVQVTEPSSGHCNYFSPTGAKGDVA